MKFVVLVPVGPSPQEIKRLDDLLNALFHFEVAQTTGVVLINDGNSEAALEELLRRYQPAASDIVTNPRGRKGDPWSDGMAAGVLAGLACIARQAGDARFVLKLDTDSLIINRFSDQILRYFDEHPQIGLVGTYLTEPGGRKRTNTVDVWARAIMKLVRLVTLWRTPTGWHSQIALWGRARAAREIVIRAVSHGYKFGESCIGGGYALSTEALQKMSSNRSLVDPCVFLNRPITEDVVVGLLASLAGVKLADFNSPGQPFGVVWEGLCDTPPELLRKGYSIIHSIKDFGDYREEATRRFFAVAREQQRSALETRQSPGPDSEG